MRDKHDWTPERVAGLKRKLLELAESGAPRPRHDSPDAEERELAAVLIALTTPPSDLN
jgi:hypothetical protein